MYSHSRSGVSSMIAPTPDTARNYPNRILLQVTTVHDQQVQEEVKTIVQHTMGTRPFFPTKTSRRALPQNKSTAYTRRECRLHCRKRTTDGGGGGACRRHATARRSITPPLHTLTPYKPKPVTQPVSASRTTEPARMSTAPWCHPGRAAMASSTADVPQKAWLATGVSAGS